ncbi:MAG: hypothetical protein WHS38_07650 [Thermodesulforhabdaceae bacterium]
MGNEDVYIGQKSRLHTLFEESLAKIEELKACTEAIADDAYGEIGELEKLVKRCQVLRTEIDKTLEEMNKLLATVSKYFDQDNDLRTWYRVFREKLREAQDITLRAMHNLNLNMEKLDKAMTRIRQTNKAIRGYEKHRTF